MKHNVKLSYLISAMTLRLEDFPENMQPYAKRNDQVYGCGTVERPYVGGWCVDGRSVSYNDEAKAWLKAHGFTHRGRRWLRTDDVGAEQRGNDRELPLSILEVGTGSQAL